MRLSAEQQKLLRAERDIIGNEACDACGAILGCVRFTRRGESGEWCSRECRDGKAQAAATEARHAARAGRPRLALSENARLSHRRKQVREAVQRHRENPDVIKNTPASL